MLKRALMIVGLLLVSACASPVAPEKLAGIKTVGVISAVGDDFSFTNSRLIAITNTHSSGAFSEWNLDGVIAARAAALLAARYKVTPVVYDKSEFMTEKGVDPIRSSIADLTRPGIEDMVRDTVKPQGLDAYIVITRADSQVVGTNERVDGVGVMQTHPFFSDRYLLHALYHITVIDGHQYTVIGSADAPPVAPPCGYIIGPCRDVSPSLWADKVDALTPSQQQQLRGDTQSLIDASLPLTLKAAGLIE